LASHREWLAEWDHAAALFVDAVGGSWRDELGPQSRPAATVGNGKPNVYHALHTTIVPVLSLSPTFATAPAQGLGAETGADEGARST
jgi:mannose/cellobiose epimerase-like protein (N-acyl-D-glucosamine 2-epimerase family)